jgi:diguanylate cyclase (GGDEF)-like protein
LQQVSGTAGPSSAAVPASPDDEGLPVLYLDRQGRIADTSSSIAGFLLYRRDELVGRNLGDITVTPQGPGGRKEVDRLLAQGHLRAGDLQLLARDGTQVRAGFQVVGQLMPEIMAVTCSIEECVPNEAGPMPEPAHAPMYGRAFEERAERALACVRDEGRPLSILSIELDRAKDIPTADDIDRDAALRTQDLPSVYFHILRPTDIVGRLSPGEYAVVLPRTDLKGALRVAERLRVSSADQLFATSRGTMSRATVSIGIATTRTARTTTQKLWSRARTLRTQARVCGGNRVVA